MADHYTARCPDCQFPYTQCRCVPREEPDRNRNPYRTRSTMQPAQESPAELIARWQRVVAMWSSAGFGYPLDVPIEELRVILTLAAKAAPSAE